MNRTLKRILIVIAVLTVTLFAAFKFMQMNTKKASPEVNVNYNEGNLKLSVFYNKPSKKGRDIFGGLVPFGKVWRTGANEATTFTSNTDLNIGGKTLPAGEYSIWTIPEKESWTVIFNKEVPSWGVSMKGIALRDEKQDALQVIVPVQMQSNVLEQLNISLADNPALALVIAWDKTKVAVPIMK
jgi:Protein of unknown function (DUF2911)